MITNLVFYLDITLCRNYYLSCRNCGLLITIQAKLWVSNYKIAKQKLDFEF